jgi:putative addiction module killer protein
VRLAIFRFKAKMVSVEIRHYLTASGKDPFQQWLDELEDLKGRIAIQRRIDRVANGNFGDHKFCRDGVWELRIDFGPGYRAYYAREEETVILLLCGGSKRAQSADIDQAVRYRRDYQRRKT